MLLLNDAALTLANEAPLFALAVYARIWLGWWSLLPLVFLIVFLWLNTRIFAPAQTDERWETRAILGEKICLDRDVTAIRDDLLRAIRLIATGSSLSSVPLIIGLVLLDPWATAFGVAGMFFGQVWLLDRFAWLYETKKPFSSDTAATADGPMCCEHVRSETVDFAELAGTT